MATDTHGGSVQLTLTTANTNYYLPTLIAAVDPTISKRCAALTIQADSANAGIVLVGDAFLSATRYGTRLAANNVTGTEGGFFNGTSTEGVYLRPDTNAQKVSVEVVLI